MMGLHSAITLCCDGKGEEGISQMSLRSLIRMSSKFIRKEIFSGKADLIREAL